MNNNWTATHDHTPGSDNLITIRGVVEVPTQQSEAKMVRAADDLNPRIMMVRVVITTPDGIDQPSAKEVEVEYTETNSHEYDSVTIIGDASGEVEIEHVH